MKKKYTVSVVFTDQFFNNPLDAAKDLAGYLKSNSDSVTYDVIDENTNEKFTVDLYEDAVLPNNENE